MNNVLNKVVLKFTELNIQNSDLKLESIPINKLLSSDHATSRCITTGGFCARGPKWADLGCHVGVWLVGRFAPSSPGPRLAVTEALSPGVAGT
jgi:hypothetical protein